MKLVLHNGEIREVDTNHIFNNQYNTIDGERIMDSEVKYIIDDIRLGEFYCSSVKQGTYEEVEMAIAETRAKINKCENCWWHHKRTKIADECTKETVLEGNREIIKEHIVYEISCAHIGQCVYDIDEKPILFRKAQQCFFCECPEGIPDMMPLKQFMVDNADKYDIVPYWASGHLTVNDRLTHINRFGSYVFETNSIGDQFFELSNARNSFRFYVDLNKKKFIVKSGIGYDVMKVFCVEKYDFIKHESYDEPIKNYDKFATWFWKIVDDFNAQKEATHEGV